MIEAFRQWLYGITVCGMVCGFLCAVLPEGSVKRVMRFICAIAMALAVVAPISGLKPETLRAGIERMAQDIKTQDEDLRRQQSESASKLLSRLTDQSVEDYARSVGLEVRSETLLETDKYGDSRIKRVNIYYISAAPEEKVKEFKSLLSDNLKINNEISVHILPGGDET